MPTLAPISRGDYTALGLMLFFAKYNLDRWIVKKASGIWLPWEYLYYLSGTLSLKTHAGLWIAAGTFVAVGVCMTLRRMGGLGWPLATVALFFVPLLNLLFFAALCVLPDRAAEGSSGWMDRLIPRSTEGSAAVGVLISAVLALGLVLLSVAGVQQYSTGLFLGVPFLSGFFSTVVYCYHGRRSLAECLAVGLMSVVVLGALLFGLVVEGIICIAMAAPVAAVMAMVGCVFGYLIQGRGAPQVAGVWLVALPLALGAEYLVQPRAEIHAATTTVEIDAPVERVWERVVRFPDLRAPEEWYFKTGIAYPVRARIEGSGVGAVRHCEFSTGAFVEPIEVWDAPRLLRFAVAKSPRPMEEWTPYGKLEAAHLDGFFESVRGEFRLEPLSGGRTRLHGTTWYRHRIFPAAYWRLWSDAIVHRIHLRVLRHVKELAERDGR